MNTEIDRPIRPVTAADIDAIVHEARADRARDMRAAFARLPALFKGLAAYRRPNRLQLPQVDLWARFWG